MSPTKKLSPARRGQPVRVLIIEDDPASAEILTQHLRMTGFDPIVPPYQTVDSALACMVNQRVDVVLLDLCLGPMMPERTILFIPNLVRAGAIVVVVSALEDATVAMAAKRLGAHAVTPKTGLPAATLASVIDEAIRTRDAAACIAKGEDIVTTVPLDESPAGGVVLDSHGHKRLRPESERTAATIIVGARKYKVRQWMVTWSKKVLPYLLALVVGGGGTHALKTLAEDGKKEAPREQATGVAPVLGEHEGRLARLEQGFHDHVQEERKTLTLVNETMERTNKKLDDVTRYLLEHAKDK